MGLELKTRAFQIKRSELILEIGIHHVSFDQSHGCRQNPSKIQCVVRKMGQSFEETVIESMSRREFCQEGAKEDTMLT